MISTESAMKIERLRELWPAMVDHCATAAEIDDDFPYNFDSAVFHFENFPEFDFARELLAQAKGTRHRYREMVTRPRFRDAWESVRAIESAVASVLTDDEWPARRDASHILSQSTKRHGWYFRAVSVGHMSRNTAAVEAAAEFLKGFGFSAGVYYRLD